jgi:peptidoglycan hydrolase-like protein with peptidoglycan-binding domain
VQPVTVMTPEDTFVEFASEQLTGVTGGCAEHETPSPPPAETGSRQNFRGAALQRALQSLGFDVGPIDGKIGRRTKAAIRAFQTQANIKIDGIVGPQTRGALTSRMGSGTTTVAAATPFSAGEDIGG